MVGYSSAFSSESCMDSSSLRGSHHLADCHSWEQLFPSFAMKEMRHRLVILAHIDMETLVGGQIPLLFKLNLGPL